MEVWALWAVLLISQNFAFTYVSRARNSASLSRHIKAALFSNGIWFVSQFILFGTLLELVTGKHGWGMAVFTGLYYTIFTITGSVLAHHFSLKTEKGKSAVGASAQYAQIPIEDWEANKEILKNLTVVITHLVYQDVLEMAHEEGVLEATVVSHG